MENFEFEISDVFNWGSGEVVGRAFAGRVLSGTVREGDKAILVVEGIQFHLIVEACEVFRKQLPLLTPETGNCGILAKIQPSSEFRTIQREKGIGCFRGMRIRGNIDV